MRVWVDLTNSPHVLVMRPVIAELRARGHEVQVTARDFAQTLAAVRALRDRAHRDRPPSRRRPARQGPGAGRALGGAGPLGRRRGFDLALGHGSNDVTVAAAMLRIPCATTFDYEWAKVQHTVNCRLAAAVVVPDVIPPERLYRYGARGKLARLSRAQGGVLPGRLRARPERAGRARAGPRRSRSRWCARRRRCRSTTASRTTCSARCWSGCAAPRWWCCRAPPSSARSCAAAGGFIVPAARDRRAVADRLRRPGGVRRRDHEPRGGGARNAGVHRVRGAARARSTSA